jgi:cytochrome c oxidase subunit 2
VIGPRQARDRLPTTARRRPRRPYTAGPVPGPRTRRSLLLAAFAALAGGLIAAPAAHAGLLFPESGGSPNADSIKTLYIMIFVVALVIFIGVEGLLIYSLIKYRARKGRVAAQIHGNTPLEIGWTIGAAAILVFITAFTFIKLGDIKDPKPSVTTGGTQVAAVDGTLLASTDQSVPKGPVLNMHVDGQQYIWAYQYPGKEKVRAYSDMVVPVGMTVILDITSDDVAHSWWIPKLGGKMDAIPGYHNKSWFQIPPGNLDKSEDLGTYYGRKAVIYTGQCAELCGRNHANMYARVIGMSPDDYRSWYQQKAAEIKQAQIAVAKQQKALQAQQQANGTQ